MKGGYYKYAAPNNVTILALNTNLYYKFNQAIPTFTNPSDPADQFKFMTDTLDAAERQRQTVHVVAHIPPGGNIYFMCARNNQFTKLPVIFSTSFYAHIRSSETLKRLSQLLIASGGNSLSRMN